MSGVTVECLRTTLKSGKKNYPLYMGFMKASDIAMVAGAPAFQDSTPNSDIAKNIQGHPIDDWQRPINDTRVKQIAETFNNTGELMPNPVLLARNAFSINSPKIVPKLVGNAQHHTGVYLVNLVANGHGKPLWILDGQHRIQGLASSAQSDNPLPVVLLLDPDTNVYQGDLLAKVFAQVTTEASPLDDLHNEWLTYAFELGGYAKGKSYAHELHQAFQVGVELCRTPTFGNLNNPFFSQVSFNVNQPFKPSFGGFSYTCVDLKDLVFKEYYKQRANTSHLVPLDVAEELARAYAGLHPLVSNPIDSCFFGTPKKQQVIMQTALFTAVLHRLLKEGKGTDWRRLFLGLNFHNTDWDFDSWASGGLSGPENTASRKAARNSLSQCLVDGALPLGVSDLADFLKGDGAVVEVAFKGLTPKGSVSNSMSKRVTVPVSVGANKSQSSALHPHVKVQSTSANIGTFKIWDANASSPTEVKQLKSGVRVDQGWKKLPAKVNIEMRFYGGQKAVGQLTIKP